jgi:hypothetical protein
VFDGNRNECRRQRRPSSSTGFGCRYEILGKGDSFSGRNSNGMSHRRSSQLIISHSILVLSHESGWLAGLERELPFRQSATVRLLAFHFPSFETGLLLFGSVGATVEKEQYMEIRKAIFPYGIMGPFPFQNGFLPLVRSAYGT